MDTKKRSDFDFFVAIGEQIRGEFEKKEDDWAESPFHWIKIIPPASRGKLGTRLISSWCAAHGLKINSIPDSEADILLNGQRTEIKFSTLWNTGIYKFQQIRDQNYKFLIALGISPFKAHCWVIDKTILKRHVIGHQPQHTGSGGTETFWFSVDPNQPDDWLQNTGGTLDKAIVILKELSRKK